MALDDAGSGDAQSPERRWLVSRFPTHGDAELARRNAFSDIATYVQWVLVISYILGPLDAISSLRCRDALYVGNRLISRHLPLLSFCPGVFKYCTMLLYAHWTFAIKSSLLYTGVCCVFFHFYATILFK